MQQRSPALAERARAHLVVIGTRFSAYARSYMADAVREWLLAVATASARRAADRRWRNVPAPTWW